VYKNKGPRIDTNKLVRMCGCSFGSPLHCWEGRGVDRCHFLSTSIAYKVWKIPVLCWIRYTYLPNLYMAHGRSTERVWFCTYLHGCIELLWYCNTKKIRRTRSSEPSPFWSYLLTQNNFVRWKLCRDPISVGPYTLCNFSISLFHSWIFPMNDRARTGSCKIKSTI